MAINSYLLLLQNGSITLLDSFSTESKRDAAVKKYLNENPQAVLLLAKVTDVASAKLSISTQKVYGDGIPMSAAVAEESDDYN